MPYAQTTTTSATRHDPTDRPLRLGCVSFLNAKPLIHGLDSGDPGQPAVDFDVPARLLAKLEAGEVDLALCPVIDYYRSETPLVMVPCGGIGCAGPTWTVRLYSRVPINQIKQVYCDTDSHSSVALLHILLAERFGIEPEFTHYTPSVAGESQADTPDTVLLIGDKVVTAPPDSSEHLHQLDLGEAWHDWTGLPFVFAVWMARRDTPLGPLPRQLVDQLELNLTRIGDIVEIYAKRHGWPADLASQYLGDVLRFCVGDPELQGIQTFATHAAKHGLISKDHIEPQTLRDF